MYAIHFANGQSDDTYDTYDAAVEAAYDRWPDAEIGHDGDLSDGGDKTLIWECENDSINDGGQHAVASIRLVD